MKMRYGYLLLVGLISLYGCITTGAMDFQEGIRSFNTGDYRRAFIKLKPEAEKGQPDAQYAIGYMYYYGQGVVEDRKKAWFWIHCAAKAGQRDAMEAMTILRHRMRSR